MSFLPQLVYDDDNNKISSFQGAAVPGGHVAYTRTASVYSEKPITQADTDAASDNPSVELLRKSTRAYTQRVGSVYLVEANLLGFAGEKTGLNEQCVLSSAVRWALADYVCRFGETPRQIVLHLDVNGTLALGDVASAKKFGKVATGLASGVLKRSDNDEITLSNDERAAIARVMALPEEQLKQQYSINYSGNDFVRALLACLGALAPTAICELDEELDRAFSDGSFNKFASKTTERMFELAKSDEFIEMPAVTVAIRTNGVESRQACVYVQRLVMGVLGIELSEANGTVRRYVVTHEDRERGLLFHPVLLEKMHKTEDGSYGFDEYCAELSSITGREQSAEAWRAVSDGTLRKKDGNFNVYLGLCSQLDAPPADCSSAPPKLAIHFARETWLMPRMKPGSKKNDFRLKERVAQSRGPWWTGFAGENRSVLTTPERLRMVHQPYHVPISSEVNLYAVAGNASTPTLLRGVDDGLTKIEAKGEPLRLTEEACGGEDVKVKVDGEPTPTPARRPKRRGLLVSLRGCFVALGRSLGGARKDVPPGRHPVSL